MKKQKRGLSFYVYTEWMHLILHYHKIMKRNERKFEIILPLMISIICTIIYIANGLVDKALSALAGLLPTSISILIGFSVMMITVLLTGSKDSIEKITNMETERELNGKKINLHQGLLIHFSHILISEVFLLLIVFFYLFLNGVWMNVCAEVFFLVIEIYLVLNILLSILRGMTNLYFSFFNAK